MLRSSERSLKPLSEYAGALNIFVRSSAYLKYAYFARALLGGMMKDMVRNILIGIFVLTLIGMYTLISTTTPSDAHPVIILFFFLLFYMSVLIVLIFLLVGVSKLLARFSSKANNSPSIGYERAYMMASVLALAPVLIVAMNSVGGVEFRELALIVVFEAIALFYLWKRR